MQYTKKHQVKTLLSKRAKLKTKLTSISKALLSGLLVSSALLGASSYAQMGLGGGISGERISTVKMPNAEFIERVIDLRVKVLGGEVKFERTWSNGSWRMNEAWSNLHFYYKDPKPISSVTVGRSAPAVNARAGMALVGGNYENKIVNVTRAGTMFELSDDNTNKDVDIYVEMGTGQSFIRRTKDNWRWYDREGNWINYDRDGRMLGYGDRNGVNVSFVRDGSWRMGVKDHYGNTVLSFTFGDGDRLASVTDNTGRKVTYQWNGNQLISVVDVDGNTWRYGYDKNGNLISRTEPDGSVMRITNHGETAKRGATQLNKQKDAVYIYPERASSSRNKSAQMARLLATKREQTEEKTPARTGSVTALNGATTLFNVSYNNASKEYTATQIDELGKNTTEVYDNVGKLLSVSINSDTVFTRQYGANNSYFKTTDERGLSTTVNNNEAGKPTRITHPDGSSETYTYDNTFNKPLTYVDQLGVKTEWTYDGKGNALTRIDAVGKPEQQFNSWTYDNYGQAITYTISSGDSIGDDAITTRYTYDANSNVKSITDPLGNTTQFTYNNQGQMTSVTNALGHTWAYAYSSAGHLKTITNPLGDSVSLEADAQGRPVKVTDALGKTSTVSYAYENKGLVMTQTDALGNATVYEFNPQNLLTRVTLPSGDQIKQVYDAKGRLVQSIDAAGNITQTQYGAAGTAVAGMPISALYPTFEENAKYNALGLPTEVTQLLGKGEDSAEEREKLTSRMNYNALGMLLSSAAPDNTTTQFQYDAFGNPTKHINALGGTTQQTYDLLGNVTSVVDAKGNTHRFEYDKNGNLTKEITPMGQATLYTYDAAAQLTSVQDAAGNVTQYEYNAVGLLVKTASFAAGSSTAEQIVSFTYDKNGQLLEVSKVANRANDVATHHKFTRDELGRMVREDITYGAGSTAMTKTLRYGYDANGRKTSLTFPDGSIQTATYQQGRLKTITRPDGQSMSWSAYQWIRAKQFNAPSVKQVFDLDALLRTQGIEAQNANNNSLLERGYTFDKAGNITLRETEEGTYTYGYDKLSRLTGATPPQAAQQQGLPVESYAYDAVHNRIGSSHQAGDWLYNGDNQLLKFGTGVEETTYTYHANGHVATETKAGVTKTYTYDATDRLVRVSQKVNGIESDIARYAYDPFGRRISKTVNGETIYFLYTDEGLVAELNEGGDITRAYGWELNTMYGTAPLWQAEVINNKLGTAQFHTLIADHLGTPQMAVNDAGTVTWKAVSESFGKTLPNAQNQITVNLRFPGQYFDEETNSHYNYFRDYNPSTGRYIQMDPVGLDAGINWYGYVDGNSLNYTDPHGLEQIFEKGGVTFYAYPKGDGRGASDETARRGPHGNYHFHLNGDPKKVVDAYTFQPVNPNLLTPNERKVLRDLADNEKTYLTKACREVFHNNGKKALPILRRRHLSMLASFLAWTGWNRYQPSDEAMCAPSQGLYSGCDDINRGPSYYGWE